VKGEEGGFSKHGMRGHAIKGEENVRPYWSSRVKKFDAGTKLVLNLGTKGVEGGDTFLVNLGQKWKNFIVAKGKGW